MAENLDQAARERLRLQEEEKEQRRIACLSPEDRAAHIEQAEKNRQTIVKRREATLNETLATLKAPLQAAREVFNRTFKRRHEEDTTIQARRRRHEFELLRSNNAAQDEERKLEATAAENRATKAQDMLEAVFRDLQYIYLHPLELRDYDPYPVLLQTPVFRARWDAARVRLRITPTLILTLSKTFMTALRDLGITKEEDLQQRQLALPDNDLHQEIALWDAFVDKLDQEKRCIIAFAIARRIRYIDVYMQTAQEARGVQAERHIPAAETTFRDFQGLADPHDVYRMETGSLARCLYKSELPNSQAVPIKTLSSNIYRPSNFQNHYKPDYWPENWEYPVGDIQHPCRKWGVNWPRCAACNRRTGPSDLPTGYTHCTCNTRDLKERILLEICQFNEFEKGTVNRGIRALQKIANGALIGEYLGKLIPLNTQENHGDQIYAIEFDGPPIVDKFGRKLNNDPDAVSEVPVGDVPPIASLIGGELGSWSRFINAPSRGQTANVSIISDVFAGKNRILIKAIRDIKFGQELVADYGGSYWQGQSDQHRALPRESAPAKNSRRGIELRRRKKRKT